MDLPGDHVTLEAIAAASGALNAADRAAFFRALGRIPPPEVPAQARVIRSPADLSRHELRECYDILDAAGKATSDAGPTPPEVTERFLRDVFTRNPGLPDSPPWPAPAGPPPAQHDGLSTVCELPLSSM